MVLSNAQNWHSGRVNKAWIISAAAFALANHTGETVLHTAALNGHLAKVPGAILTREALLARTTAGDTVLHAAALSGHLDHIPPAHLVHDTLILGQFR